MGPMADEKANFTEDAKDVAKSCREGDQERGVAPDSLPPGSGGVVANVLQEW